MARETSIEAYHKVRKAGILSDLRLKVFKILCFHGPMTANEMRQFGDPNANSGVYSTRLSELRRMGAVKEIGKRPCKTTGYNAFIWDVTGEMPVNLPKEITKKDKMSGISNHLRNCRGSIKNGILTTDETTESYKHFVYAIEELDKILILL